MSNDRVEDLLGQLIKMVGNLQQKQSDMDAKLNQVLTDQHDVKEDLKRIKEHIVDTSETVSILVHRFAEHDIAIQKIKRKLVD